MKSIESGFILYYSFFSHSFFLAFRLIMFMCPKWWDDASSDPSSFCTDVAKNLRRLHHEVASCAQDLDFLDLANHHVVYRFTFFSIGSLSLQNRPPHFNIFQSFFNHRLDRSFWIYLVEFHFDSFDCLPFSAIDRSRQTCSYEFSVELIIFSFSIMQNTWCNHSVLISVWICKTWHLSIFELY